MEMLTMVLLWQVKLLVLFARKKHVQKSWKISITGAAKVIKEEAARWADVNV